MKIKSFEIFDPLYQAKNVRVFIKRLDQINSDISGNKYFKLKYNIIYALDNSFDKIITFGGAFSNHLLATSIITRKYNLKSYGIVRGEQHDKINPILKQCLDNGMKLYYISRADYKLKEKAEFVINLLKKINNIYIIPEGGTNDLAVKGTQEILSKEDNYKYICCCVGTGGTISGVINSSSESQKIIGFSSLKGVTEFNTIINNYTNKNNWNILDDYCFNGFAKINNQLISFINTFDLKHNIPLDAIYTGKMVYGIHEMIRKNLFSSNSSILIIHSGGLSGNLGINFRYNLALKTK